MSDSLLAVDGARGNILDAVDKLEKRVRELEIGGGGGSGTAAGVTGAVTASDTVSVSANDTLAGYLDAKLVASLPVTLTQQNDGANESLLVSIAPHLVANAHHNWPLLDSDIPATIVRTSRQVIAGAGLTGGGDLSANRTFNVGAGNGITVSADNVALTTPGSLSASSTNNAAGNHTHTVTASSSPGAAASLLKTDGSGQLIVQILETPLLTASGFVASSLIPWLTDAYDLGSSAKLWRKGWLSELESVLFVQNSIQVTGGWWMIPHASGTFPNDVADTDTQIDFGVAMTPNDFVLMRGNLLVEYLQIGALVSGTTYNVTRNLDGSGANNWPAGQVFAVLGNTGDGRIEFDAQTAAPRMMVYEQKAAYNDQVERVRLGDLTGWGSLTGYGIAIGIPGGDRLTYDPTNGLVIAGEGSGVTSINGGNIQTNTITTTQLTATAIDGMTITGATIRTSITNEVVMDSDGLTIMPAFDGWDPVGTSSVKWSNVGLIEGRLDTDLVEPNDPLYAYVRVTTDGGTTKDASIHLSTQINPSVADYAGVVVTADQMSISAPVSVTGTLYTTGVITGSAGARLEGLEIGRLTLTPTARQIRLYHLDTTFVGQLSVDANYLRLNQDTGKSVYVNGTFHTQGGVNAVTGITLGAFSVPIANELRMYNGATLVGQISVTDTAWLRLNQGTGKNTYTVNSVAIGTHLAVGHTNIGSAGDISYTGTLRSRKNSTYYDVFGTSPLVSKLTSASWNATAKTTANNGVIDLSAVFGVPAGVKSVKVRFQVSGAAGTVAWLGPNSSNDALYAVVQSASYPYVSFGDVPCDGNGDIYFNCSGNCNVAIVVFGYSI